MSVQRNQKHQTQVNQQQKQQDWTQIAIENNVRNQRRTNPIINKLLQITDGQDDQAYNLVQQNFEQIQQELEQQRKSYLPLDQVLRQRSGIRPDILSVTYGQSNPTEMEMTTQGIMFKRDSFSLINSNSNCASSRQDQTGRRNTTGAFETTSSAEPSTQVEQWMILKQQQQAQNQQQNSSTQKPATQSLKKANYFIRGNKQLDKKLATPPTQKEESSKFIRPALKQQVRKAIFSRCQSSSSPTNADNSNPQKLIQNNQDKAALQKWQNDALAQFNEYVQMQKAAQQLQQAAQLQASKQEASKKQLLDQQSQLKKNSSHNMTSMASSNYLRNASQLNQTQQRQLEQHQQQVQALLLDTKNNLVSPPTTSYLGSSRKMMPQSPKTAKHQKQIITSPKLQNQDAKISQRQRLNNILKGETTARQQIQTPTSQKGYHKMIDYKALMAHQEAKKFGSTQSVTRKSRIQQHQHQPGQLSQTTNDLMMLGQSGPQLMNRSMSPFGLVSPDSQIFPLSNFGGGYLPFDNRRKSMQNNSLLFMSKPEMIYQEELVSDEEGQYQEQNQQSIIDSTVKNTPAKIPDRVTLENDESNNKSSLLNKTMNSGSQLSPENLNFQSLVNQIAQMPLSIQMAKDIMDGVDEQFKFLSSQKLANTESRLEQTSPNQHSQLSKQPSNLLQNVNKFLGTSYESFDQKMQVGLIKNKNVAQSHNQPILTGGHFYTDQSVIEADQIKKQAKRLLKEAGQFQKSTKALHRRKVIQKLQQKLLSSRSICLDKPNDDLPQQQKYQLQEQQQFQENFIVQQNNNCNFQPSPDNNNLYWDTVMLNKITDCLDAIQQQDDKNYRNQNRSRPQTQQDSPQRRFFTSPSLESKRKSQVQEIIRIKNPQRETSQRDVTLGEIDEKGEGVIQVRGIGSPLQHKNLHSSEKEMILSMNKIEKETQKELQQQKLNQSRLRSRGRIESMDSNERSIIQRDWQQASFQLGQNINTTTCSQIALIEGELKPTGSQTEIRAKESIDSLNRDTVKRHLESNEELKKTQATVLELKKQNSSQIKEKSSSGLQYKPIQTTQMLFRDGQGRRKSNVQIRVALNDSAEKIRACAYTEYTEHKDPQQLMNAPIYNCATAGSNQPFQRKKLTNKYNPIHRINLDLVQAIQHRPSTQVQQSYNYGKQKSWGVKPRFPSEMNITAIRK